MNLSHGGRPTVWIADDSPTDAAIARRILEGVYETVVFPDGESVVEAFGRETPPDVLVLDWVMPEISGLDVCRFLRRGEPRGASSRILLFTGHRADEDIQLAFEAGADDYLSKPYSPEELRARVGGLVRMKSLLERAERAEAAYRELYDAAPDGLLSADPDGRVRVANRRAADILELTPEGLSERPHLGALFQTLTWSPDGASASGDLAAAGHTYAVSVRRAEGPQALVSVSLRDVTAEREAARRRLDLYSVVAHDLRSPLTAMLMRTQVILRGGRGLLSAQLVNDIQRIEHRIRSLVGMINDFLDLAQLEDGARRIRRAPVPLAELVDQIVDDFSALAAVESVELRADPSPPPVVEVTGDRDRLLQVLTNLVGNALKFTPEGGQVTVGLAVEAAEVELSVHDTGPGIAPEDQARIFERYERTPEGERALGTGLGLMIVRQIVEAHGGRVGVTSRPGEGSRFWARLPLAAPSGAG